MSLFLQVRGGVRRDGTHMSVHLSEVKSAYILIEVVASPERRAETNDNYIRKMNTGKVYPLFFFFFIAAAARSRGLGRDVGRRPHRYCEHGMMLLKGMCQCRLGTILQVTWEWLSAVTVR